MIGCLHEFIKDQLIINGVDSLKIWPPKGVAKPECTMAGLLKYKAQDICVLSSKKCTECIQDGVLAGEQDLVGKDCMNTSISINVRSQLSSLMKNYDTLVERTFAEPLNLHLRAPKLVMGEVYMVPVVAYDPAETAKNRVGFKENLSRNYLRLFQALNMRNGNDDCEYKYERVCLLIVDFRKKQPAIIDSLDPLIEEGIITKNEANKYSMRNLDIDNFVKDLLNVYQQRHGNIDMLSPSKKNISFFLKS